MNASSDLLTAVVCTRGRSEHLAVTLDALESEAAGRFPVLVVDQSDEPDPGLERRSAAGRVRVIRDPGRGLSRARNVALRDAGTRWVAYVDDDCSVEPGFGSALVGELEAHPDADWVAGHVGAGHRVEGDLPVVTTFPVAEVRVRRGRWILPGSIGFGVLFVVRRETAARLGGWDERLGPGAPRFPAADDMDFNHRLLRAGGTAVATPALRAVHRQWRSPEELVALNRGYLRAWTGFAAKQLRTGHPVVGAWLWTWGVIDVVDMTASALSHRSRVRARIAASKLTGLLEGTLAGLRRQW